jgi:hypothetical protein
MTLERPVAVALRLLERLRRILDLFSPPLSGRGAKSRTGG